MARMASRGDKSRRKGVLALTDTFTGALIKMAENNPGAISVMMKLNELPHGFIDLCHLDDMEIRGYKIWLCYRDYCKGDINKLHEYIVTRDKGMIDYLENFEKTKKRDF